MHSIGSLFGKLGGLFHGQQGGNRALGLGLGIPSIIGQFLQSRQQSHYINNVLDLIKRYQDPNWVSGQLGRLTPALNQNLIQSVSNPVQAFLGERGLSQAPGLAASAETQALAPFAQQNIQTAASLLGLPLQAANTGSYAFLPQQPSSLGGILQLLMGGPQGPQKAGPSAGGPMPAGGTGPIAPVPPFEIPPPDNMPWPEIPQGPLSLPGLAFGMGQ